MQTTLLHLLIVRAVLARIGLPASQLLAQLHPVNDPDFRWFSYSFDA